MRLKHYIETTVHLDIVPHKTALADALPNEKPACDFGDNHGVNGNILHRSLEHVIEIIKSEIKSANSNFFFTPEPI